VFYQRQVQVVADLGRDGDRQDAVRLVRGDSGRDPAEPGDDAVDVRIDREGRPAHGEDEHAGGGLRSHAWQ